MFTSLLWIDITLYEDQNGDGVYAAGTDAIIATTTTDADGWYSRARTRLMFLKPMCRAVLNSPATYPDVPVYLWRSTTSYGGAMVDNDGSVYEYVFELSEDVIDVDFGFNGAGTPTAVSMLGMNGRVLSQTVLIAGVPAGAASCANQDSLETYQALPSARVGALFYALGALRVL